ncbi:hypothetical protein Cs7R123_61430 [Catellatospora sp. TT07R-123]|uniref:DUF2625 family protein n=1 Tax=Catellatospora sp. TT07R-123 TaxID=2733863 RepID=UPI001B10F988|nr:DUF2625 family protein [Catellatospora sp. TT07R-123]GHJ48801.1 hypothetical protein Cs7R123_61430 [Catellatospora sp. TT07R-123]
MQQSAWPEVLEAVAGAPYPVEVLPADPERARRCLDGLEITERSWLGAVTLHSGGLLIDHGWLRVLGGGTDTLPDVLAEADPSRGGLVIAYDVLGGIFIWAPAGPGAAPTVHYFAPDSLRWEDLDLGYGQWLGAMLSGALTGFAEGLRWPGWAEEVAQARPDQGINTFPPLWTKEGKDLSAVSRKAIPLTELVSYHQHCVEQLGG